MRSALFPLLIALAGCAGSAPSRAPASIAATEADAAARLIDSAMANGRYGGLLLLNPADEAPSAGVDCQTEAYIRDRGCARGPRGYAGCPADRPYAYFRGSCWSDEVPEISKSPDGELSVDAPIFDKYERDAIARSLIFRHYRNYEKARITPAAFSDPAYSLYADVELHLAFDDGLIGNIAVAGFLNQHQTGTSKGSLNSNARWRVEEGYLHVKLPHADPRAADLAPKSVFGVPTGTVIASRRSTYSPQYGNVIAVLSPALKDRMTITMGDSLDLFILDENRWINTFKWINSDPDFHLRRRYVEAQVWGSLGTKDVVRFLVNCPGLNPVGSDRIRAIYETTRIPVYACGKSERYAAERFYAADIIYGTRGERINSGDSPATDPPLSIAVLNAKDGSMALSQEEANRLYADCDRGEAACSFDALSAFARIPDGVDVSLILSCAGSRMNYRVSLPAPFPREGRAFKVAGGCENGKPSMRIPEFSASDLVPGPARIGVGTTARTVMSATVLKGRIGENPSKLSAAFSLADLKLPATENRPLTIAYGCTRARGVEKRVAKIPFEGGKYRIELDCVPKIQITP